MSGIAQQVKRVRKRLGENTVTFGERFFVSGRAVEGWEQGRFLPRKRVQEALDALETPQTTPTRADLY